MGGLVLAKLQTLQVLVRLDSVYHGVNFFLVGSCPHNVLLFVRDVLHDQTYGTLIFGVFKHLRQVVQESVIVKDHHCLVVARPTLKKSSTEHRPI